MPRGWCRGKGHRRGWEGRLLLERGEGEARGTRAPPHLAVEIAADGFLGPGLVVKLSPALLLRVACHICHHLGGSSGVSPEPGPPPALV